MELFTFINRMKQASISLTPLIQQHAYVVDQLALSWEWSLKFGRLVDELLLNHITPSPLTEELSTLIRQINHQHSLYRGQLRKLAPLEHLKKNSELNARLLEHEQMPVTDTMKRIFQEFQKLVQKDDLRAIHFLQSNGIGVNQKDRDGLTPLAYAAQYGSEKCLFALCKQDANPHLTDTLGNKPLHWAVAMEKPKSAFILLFFGANPNAVNHSGITPLMLSTSKSNLLLAQKLLDYGGDLRIKDRQGMTALHRAVNSNHYESIRFLLDSGAPTDEPNNMGQTPLTLSLKKPDIHRLFKQNLNHEFVFSTPF